KADQSLACARKAISEGVVASVGTEDVYNAQTYPLYERNSIAIVGPHIIGSPIEYQSPVVFPLSGGGVTNFSAQPFMLKALGKHKVAALVVDVAAARAAIPVIQRAVQAAGLQYVGSINVAVGATDMLPYAAKAKQLGADSVIHVVSAAQGTPFMKAAATLKL